MTVNQLSEQKPFTTADGSTIRSILDATNAPVEKQSLAEASLPAGGQTQRHYHKLSEEIYFILEGEAKMEIDGETRTVKPNDAILIPPNAWHQITATTDTRFLCCCAPIYSHEDTYFEEEESGPDWNQRYLDGDTPWDKGTYTPALLEILSKQVIPVGTEVLVPGCGYAHDARAIADAGYSATGMDIATSAVKGARLAHQGIEGLEIIQADLFDAQLPDKKRYGAIWEHTCYCAILPDQRADYVAAVHNLLEKDSLLIGVFFTNTEMPPGEGPPFETSVADVHQLFSNYFELLWEKEPDQTFPSRKGCEWLMVWRKKS